MVWLWFEFQDPKMSEKVLCLSFFEKYTFRIKLHILIIFTVCSTIK